MEQKKHLLIINQTAGSAHHGMVYRNYYLGREWVKQGHRVTIITSSYFHNFKKIPDTTGLFTHELIDGIDYWWVRMPKYSESRSFGRLLAIILFPFLLILFPFWKLGRTDSIIVSSPPHTSIVNAWIWSKIFRAKLIFEVRDIWPLTIIKLGKVSPYHPVILVLSFFESFAYKVSDRVVSVLSLAGTYFETRGMDGKKFVYLPNGVDTTQTVPTSSSTSIDLKKIGQNKKIVIYAGSFGIANNLDQFLDAAKLLLPDSSIHFALIGDGPHRKALEFKARDLPNVTIFNSVPKDQIPGILAEASICYVGLMKSDLFKHGVSPNKLFDYMAASKPVIMAIDTDDRIVEKANCGIAVPSCLPEDIAKAVGNLSNLDAEKLWALGRNGRTYLERNHSYSSLSKKYIDVINSISSIPGKQDLAASPFKIGFGLVILLGILTHLLFSAIFPAYFREGMTIFLKDPFIFHDLAVTTSKLPWSEFSLVPYGQLPAGFLALVYKVFGIHKPFMFLPFLAVLAGLTTSAITACLRTLGVRGRWWPLIIAIGFTITPTSISWMIYPHKDSFIVPGVLLITSSLLSVISRGGSLSQFFIFLFGSLLVFSSKSYFAEIFLVGFLLSTIFTFTFERSRFLGKFIFLGFSLSVLTFTALTKSRYTNDGDFDRKDLRESTVQTSPLNQYAKEVWKETLDAQSSSKPRQIVTMEEWKDLPIGNLLNKPLRAMAFTRERFLHERNYANTNFHPEIHLKSSWDTISYIPRALQLSLLEPLPLSDTEGHGARKILFILVKLEMFLVYASLLFILLSGRKIFRSNTIICLALALPFLLAFGMAVPNVGSINRYRFPFLLLIKLAGLAALWNSSRFKWPGRLLMWIDPPELKRPKKKLLFLVPDDATFVIQRLVMAQGAQKAGYDVHVACPDLGHGQKIREFGFTFHLLDLNRGGLNPFADFLPFIRLVRFLAKERPDILQCVSIKPVIYGATAGTMVGLKRISCLVNGLGYAFEGRGTKGKVVLFVAKALYRNALAMPGVRVIFQNPDDQQYFIRAGIVDANKTLLIRGSGVNMQKFIPTPPPQNPEPVILFVGRLLWSKGIRELVEAATKLKGEGLKFRLRIVGVPDDRNPESVPSEYLKENHDKGIIEWLGRQTDMPKFYRESDVITLPTAYREGLPLTLLEAASTGRPLISTDMPGCREIVRDGENGFLVPSQNSDELANALRKLIVDSELRKRFGESSAEIVRQEFSSEIVQQKLLSVYDELLSDSPHSELNSVTTA